MGNRGRLFSLEDETPGQYRYALDSTGMLWAVPVCSGQYRYALGSTGMLWAVPVCFWGRYVLGSTGMLWEVPVLPKAYRYCPDHTGTVQIIPVLPREYRYCPEEPCEIASAAIPGPVQVIDLDQSKSITY